MWGWVKLLLLALGVIVVLSLGLAFAITGFVLQALQAHGVDIDVSFDIDRPYALSETIEQTIDATGKTALLLENPRGVIRLVGGSENTVALEITRKADSPELLPRLVPEISAEGERIDVRLAEPKDAEKREGEASWRVDYVVRVPPGLRLRVEQKVGEIRLHDYETPRAVEIELGLGNLEIRDVRAFDVEADVGVGGVELLGVVAPRVRADVGVGDLKITIPKGAAFRVNARVSLGSLDLDIPSELFAGPWEIARGGIGPQSGSFLLQAGDAESEAIGELKLRVGVGNLTISLED